MRLGGELEAGILEWEFFENGSFYFSFFPALKGLLSEFGIKRKEVSKGEARIASPCLPVAIGAWERTNLIQFIDFQVHFGVIDRLS